MAVSERVNIARVLRVGGVDGRISRWGRLFLFALMANVLFIVFYAVLAQHFGGYSQATCRWDCGWYMKIVRDGYDTRLPAPGDPYRNYAFFPVFPLTVYYVSHLTGIVDQFAADIVNNIAFCFTLFVSALYISKKFGGNNTYFYVLVFLSAPFSIYFHFPYSESLYGLFLILFLFFFYRRAYPLAGLAGLFLSATRPTGALVIATVCCIEWLTIWLSEERPFRITEGRVRRSGAVLLAAVISSAGIFSYMTYLHFHVGDALAFKHIEAAWGRQFINPVTRVLLALRSHDMTADSFVVMTMRSQAYLAWAAIVAFILILWGFCRRFWIESSVMLVTLYTATSSGLEALPRFMFANPVMLCMIARFLDFLPREFALLVLILFGMTQAVFVILWYGAAAFLT